MHTESHLGSARNATSSAIVSCWNGALLRALCGKYATPNSQITDISLVLSIEPTQFLILCTPYLQLVRPPDPDSGRRVSGFGLATAEVVARLELGMCSPQLTHSQHIMSQLIHCVFYSLFCKSKCVPGSNSQAEISPCCPLVKRRVDRLTLGRYLARVHSVK